MLAFKTPLEAKQLNVALFIFPRVYLFIITVYILNLRPK